MDKKDKTERQRQEDAALVKILYWMCGAAILVGLLRLAQRYYVDFDTSEAAINLAWFIGKALPWMFVAGLILAGGAFFLALRVKRAGKAALLPGALGALLLGGALCALGVWQMGAGGIQLLTYVTIGMGVLALIYYLYQRDFSVVILISGLGMLGLWLLFRLNRGTRLYLAMTVLLVLLAVIAVCARYLQKNGGAVAFKGKRIEILPNGAAYALVYVSCGLMALTLAAALILGGTLSAMTYYAVPVAWGLIMAVYYTVKLM